MRRLGRLGEPSLPRKVRKSARLLFLILSVTALPLLPACRTVSGDPIETEKPDRPVHLVGKVVGNSYQSLLGKFTVPFPVSREGVNGRIIRDDTQSVTFHDNWGSTISFYSTPFSPDSGMMKTLHDEGPEQALTTLAKDIYGNSIVPHYHADVRGGTVSFVFLRPVLPPTGVAEFVHGNHVYLVETDLVPGVELLSKSDDQSIETRNQWLENRAVELLKSMSVD